MATKSEATKLDAPSVEERCCKRRKLGEDATAGHAISNAAAASPAVTTTESSETCCMCCQVLSEPDGSDQKLGHVQLPCRHRLHLSCCFNDGNFALATCPLCRAQIPFAEGEAERSREIRNMAVLQLLWNSMIGWQVPARVEPILCDRSVERGSLRPGSCVRVKEEITKPRHGWGPVQPNSVGIVIGQDADGDYLVNFPEADRWWAAADEIERIAEAESVRVGCRVRVKPSVRKPRYNWGMVNAGDVGTVLETKCDGHVLVAFSRAARWKGVVGELELVEGA